MLGGTWSIKRESISVPVFAYEKIIRELRLIGEAGQREIAAHVTGGHDHDHGLGLSRREQIILDEIGMANRGPRVIVVCRAMHQIEGRIALAARLITGGR